MVARRADQAVSGSAVAFVGRGGLVVGQKIDANGRRQCRLISVAGDRGDDLVHALAFALANSGQRLPHRRLQADAGAMTGDGHVAVDQRRAQFDVGLRLSFGRSRLRVWISSRHGLNLYHLLKVSTSKGHINRLTTKGCKHFLHLVSQVILHMGFKCFNSLALIFFVLLRCQGDELQGMHRSTQLFSQ